MKELTAFGASGLAMLFSQADPTLPPWLNGATQITGWFVLAWLVFHTHSKTLPSTIKDCHEESKAQREHDSAELDKSRQANAEMLNKILDANTTQLTKVVDAFVTQNQEFRDRLHRVGDILGDLTAKIQYQAVKSTEET